MTGRKTKSKLPAPFLHRLTLIAEKMEPEKFPFTLPIFRDGLLDIEFKKRVTIFVGENGTGKSTLLEAIAHQCGFNLYGGNRNHVYKGGQGDDADVVPLSHALRLSWLPRMTSGFFMRAESFFHFATFLGEQSFEAEREFARDSLHKLSHGESFMALMKNRFAARGIYILDEPEAALSPSRQLAFMAFLRGVEETGDAQFLIATHSPMLMAYPGAEVLQIEGSEVLEVDYRETRHFQLFRRFLESPERYFAHLLSPARDETGPP
jgi:predicted ATPase